MIQKTNARASGGVTAPARQGVADESPESWGLWVGRKHYALQVVQNPQRARMCGFGDKDRRPLAPAAVAKMIVQQEDGSLVDVDEIDVSFFLVTVDLWSSDGKHEMNLVLHPTSADRYVPANTPKAKRRGTKDSASSSQRTGRQSPTPSAPASSTSQYPQSSGMTPYIAPSSPGYSSQAYSYPAPQAPTPESPGFQPMNSYGNPSDAPPWGGYPPPPTSMERGSQYPPPPVLPSIHSLSRNGSSSGPSAAGVGYNSASASGTGAGENWHLENQGREDAEGISYRTWPQEASYSPIDNNGVSQAAGAIDPSLRGTHASSSGQELRENSYAPLAPPSPADTYSHNRYPQQPYPPLEPQHNTNEALDHSSYSSASYPQQSHQHQAQSSQYQEAPYPQDPTPPSTIPPLPRHTYTRTLVGPLSANACRLLDEHRKPGIFFLFQDLSIRTEGTFRLRLRLMNVGAPPAPEMGAPRVHTSVSPVLAQTFTNSFIVYSAKRFPGVPDTTALSIALGNQGQKLPLRNRNGSTKQGRKRQRSGSDASGDESDET